MKRLLICIGLAVSATALTAATVTQTVVTVGAPAINCVFNTNCTSIVTDTSSPILLPNTTARTAARIAEVLRMSIQEMVIAFESANLKVTVSCGVATALPAGDSPEALVRRADRALYAAKAAGRNCVREAEVAA